MAYHAGDTRPAGDVAGESVPGGAGGYRVDTGLAFVGRGGRRHRPAYLGGRSIGVETGIRFRFRGVPKGGVRRFLLGAFLLVETGHGAPGGGLACGVARYSSPISSLRPA